MPTQIRTLAYAVEKASLQTFDHWITRLVAAEETWEQIKADWRSKPWWWRVFHRFGNDWEHEEYNAIDDIQKNVDRALHLYNTFQPLDARTTVYVDAEDAFFLGLRTDLNEEALYLQMAEAKE